MMPLVSPQFDPPLRIEPLRGNEAAYAQLQKITSADQLYDALNAKRPLPGRRMGELMVETHLISRDQLEVALEFQRHNEKKHLGEILVDLDFVTRDQLYLVLCQKLGIPFVDLARFAIDARVLKALPHDLVRKNSVVPLCQIEGRLVVAVADPLDPAPLEHVRFLAQAPITPVMATAEDIHRAIALYYGGVPEHHEVQQIARQLSSELVVDDAREETIKETDNTLVRLVNKIITDANTAGASDIHIETNRGRESVVIRFRNDGVLSEYLRLPHNFRSAAVSRVKVMAGLDISERRRAQDGRISFKEFAPLDIELRVVTMPTRDGLEDVVMRLLTASEPIPIRKLGLSDNDLARVHDLIRKPYGLILAAGPTGSGKTTTLHSLISVINEPGTKIWTAENPVEITQPGLRQVQVNARIGWDFATVMRAFLRADPDVIMVGEMRDQETAGIGVEASLTGHLVFSTLHTNSAAETVLRLLDMGIDPFSFADSLLGVLAQRLARRLCLNCRVKQPALPVEIEALAEEYCYDTDLKVGDVVAGWQRRYGTEMFSYEAKGCSACRKTGYRGRMGLFELLVMTPQLRQMMLRRASAVDIRSAAMAEGMRTLKQDGLEKCLTGDTDLHEVRAAVL